jgi:DNA-binding CsgD family transcriptional regulator
MPFQKIKYLFLILLCVAVRINAQTAHVLTNEAIVRIKTYDVLRDSQYPFDRVHTDSTLPFLQNSSLSTAGTDYYWVKLAVENPYPNKEEYRLSLSLRLNYILYFFDYDKKEWVRRSAGLAVPAQQRDRESVPLFLQGDAKNTLYLRIDIRDIQSYGYSIHPTIILEKQLAFDNRESFLWYSWLGGIFILLSFCGYSLYIYWQLKDNIYLCYLAVQIGGIIFVTSFKHFFNLFLPFGIYNVRLNADGTVYAYDTNAFFLHIASIIIISGAVLLTRIYLRTEKLLPFCDKLLKYLTYGYVTFAIVPAVITITGLRYLDNFTLLYDNVIIVTIMLAVIFTCVVAYKRKVRAATHFLLANILPLLFIVGFASYYIVHSAPTYLDNHLLLPEMAIFSQIFTFAVALLARVRVVNEELKIKESELEKLETDIAQATYKCELIEKENEVIAMTIQEEKDKNDLLQQKLEANQRELVGNSLYIHQKNKLLADLKDQLQDIDNLYPHVKHPGLKNIKSSLKDGQHLDAEWDKFKLHFEQVHPDFFGNLQSSHPTLTKNELRLYAYFHIHLSTKEIAALLNIEPASVRQAKARLNKKMSNPTGSVSSSRESND